MTKKKKSLQPYPQKSGYGSIPMDSGMDDLEAAFDGKIDNDFSKVSVARNRRLGLSVLMLGLLMMFGLMAGTGHESYGVNLMGAGINDTDVAVSDDGMADATAPADTVADDDDDDDAPTPVGDDDDSADADADADVPAPAPVEEKKHHHHHHAQFGVENGLDDGAIFENLMLKAEFLEAVCRLANAYNTNMVPLQEKLKTYFVGVLGPLMDNFKQAGVGETKIFVTGLEGQKVVDKDIKKGLQRPPRRIL